MFIGTDPRESFLFKQSEQLRRKFVELSVHSLDCFGQKPKIARILHQKLWSQRSPELVIVHARLDPHLQDQAQNTEHLRVVRPDKRLCDLCSYGLCRISLFNPAQNVSRTYNGDRRSLGQNKRGTLESIGGESLMFGQTINGSDASRPAVYPGCALLQPLSKKRHPGHRGDALSDAGDIAKSKPYNTGTKFSSTVRNEVCLHNQVL